MTNEDKQKDASSEFLRLSLPLMSKNDVPVTPPNYAVWYEYVAGVNEPLQREIDSLVDKGVAVDEDMTRELHRKFVQSFDQERFDRARQSLKAIVAEIGDTMRVAGDEVDRYQESLGDYSNRMSGEMNVGDLRGIVKALTVETQAVRDTSAEVHERLKESRKEAEALREELEKAKEEASTDALTGLANRKAFDFAMERLAADPERQAQPNCLLMGDIDHFKKVNDTYGHLLGDKVIKYVASTMKQSVKGKDLVARFGGEEFAVLLPNTHLDGAMALAETIRSTIENGRLVRADTRQPIGAVTISIGVARYRPGESTNSLIGRADEALYRAKNGGRNQVQAEAADSPATGTTG